MTPFSPAASVICICPTIGMAPLTQAVRRSADRVIHALMARHYAQRAGFGLGVGHRGHAAGRGLCRHAGAVERGAGRGLARRDRAVHAAGGRIVAQLWHVGRISDRLVFLGRAPVAPSGRAGWRGQPGAPEAPYVTPRALALNELPGIVAATARR